VLHTTQLRSSERRLSVSGYECLIESTKAVANSDNVTGNDMKRRVQGTGISLPLGAWQRASLPGTCVEEGCGDGHLSP